MLSVQNALERNDEIERYESGRLVKKGGRTKSNQKGPSSSLPAFFLLSQRNTVDTLCSRNAI